ncbi:hypothetical protein A1OQ_21595 [Enterovibrio norvegicus FF-162]|nr:hypothetical protein A1OQ_21595 [Enterovibrio norvegicus FF-162]
MLVKVFVLSVEAQNSNQRAFSWWFIQVIWFVFKSFFLFKRVVGGKPRTIESCGLNEYQGYQQDAISVRCFSKHLEYNGLSDIGRFDMRLLSRR